jgi:hypothetical protein
VRFLQSAQFMQNHPELLPASLGNDQAARDAARRAIALVRDRSSIEPDLMARIDSLARPYLSAPGTQ